MFRRLSLLATLAAGLPVLATDGYFSMGYGTASKGMGGASAALALDALAPASNPAALVFLGSQVDAGLAWFSPDRSFEVKGAPTGYPGTFGLRPGKYTSGSKAFAVPTLGASWKLSDRLAFGVALYGNGGMNTNYDESVFGGGSTGVNLSQCFLAPTLAWRFADHQSVGLSAVAAWQKFEVKGLSMFGLMGFSSDPSALSDRGRDTSTGFGVRLGWQGRFGAVDAGASWQSRTRMGEFTRYKGLFAEGGGFDIPSNVTLGLAWHATSSLTVALDAERIRYSEVRSIGNPMLPNLVTAPLGRDGGAGFGWRDIDVWKLGVSWQATPEWTLRAGYNQCDQPIPQSEVMFNILAPGVVRRHLTVGATRAFGKASALSFSVIRALEEKVTGPNPLEAPGAQTITLAMSQWDVELGFTVRF